MTTEQVVFYSTGVKNLDQLLGGGLFLGENVLWETETGTFDREFLYAFMRQGINEGSQVIYLDFIYPPQALMLHFSPLIKMLPNEWEKKLLSLTAFRTPPDKENLFSATFTIRLPLG